MRTRTDAGLGPDHVVPPFNGHASPHETFPPWQSLRRVFDLVAPLLRRCAIRADLKHLEVPLIQASKRIVAVAGGDLPADHWHRRARVAVEKLERAKRAIALYVRHDMLSTVEAVRVAGAIDETIVSLVEAVAHVRLPDEIRRRLPELHVPPRLVH